MHLDWTDSSTQIVRMQAILMKSTQNFDCHIHCNMYTTTYYDYIVHTQYIECIASSMVCICCQRASRKTCTLGVKSCAKQKLAREKLGKMEQRKKMHALQFPAQRESEKGSLVLLRLQLQGAFKYYVDKTRQVGGKDLRR